MSVRAIAMTLRPTPEQAAALDHLQRQWHAACAYISEVAWQRQEFAQFSLHILVYGEVRQRFGLLAQHTIRAIAIEELGGIRARDPEGTPARRPQRATLHSWSFDQLRQFLQYKAKLAGVLVVAVDPRNSSRTCPGCGSVSKANRPSQSCFSCQSCGLSGHADLIAATVLRDRGRAAVNPPYIPCSGVSNTGGTSSLLSGGRS